MPQIQRYLPPAHVYHGVAGPHIIGDQTIDFDEHGLAEVTDPALVEELKQWPESFVVLPPPPELPPSEPPAEERAPAPATATDAPEPPARQRYTTVELDNLAVFDLQRLATTAGIRDATRLRKAELIRAILAAQEG
jgi:hypothetical protein